MSITKRHARWEVDDRGFSRLVAEMILSAVKDLATLRRAGLWFDHPDEVAENMRVHAGTEGIRGANRLLIAQGTMVDVGTTSSDYLRGLCAMAEALLEMHVEPSQLVRTAKRYSEECNHVRARDGKRKEEREARKLRGLYSTGIESV